jgi:hypothetical protein
MAADGFAWTLLFLAFIATFVLTLQWLASRHPDGWPWGPKDIPGWWPFGPKEE